MKNALDQIYEYIDQHFDEHLAATQRYLRQPSISTQNVGIQECAEITTKMLRNPGCEARVVPLEGSHPVAYGYLASKSSKRNYQTISHLTMAGDDLGYRAPKTRLVLDK